MSIKLHVDKEKIFKGIYNGDITLYKLPKDLYVQTAFVLLNAVFEGYLHGHTPTKHVMNAHKPIKPSLGWGTADSAMVDELEINMYMFSAAKTFQQCAQMTELLIDDKGLPVSESEFFRRATKVFDTFNDTEKGYLATERITAMSSARSAAQWVDIEKHKKVLPYLRWDTVGGERVCPICRPLNGIVLLSTHPFWKTNFSPAHFRCMCAIHQLSQDEIQEWGGITEEKELKVKEEDSKKTKDPIFNFNPGIDKTIFKDTGKYKHPYFEVSKKYKELAKKNFNLSIPNEDNKKTQRP